MKKEHRLIVDYIDDHNFGPDWVREPNKFGEFSCWGPGHHLDAYFKVDEIKEDGTVYGVIYPGSGAFVIGNMNDA